MKRLDLEQSSELRSAFTLREAKMKTGHKELAVGRRRRQRDASLKSAALFAPPNFQVDPRATHDRQLGQHCVTVAPNFEAVLGGEGKVLELGLGGKFLYLNARPGGWPIVRDLLQECYVRIDGAQYGNDAVQSIAAVETANPFVNVPGKHSQLHADQHRVAHGRRICYTPLAFQGGMGRGASLKLCKLPSPYVQSP